MRTSPSPCPQSSSVGRSGMPMDGCTGVTLGGSKKLWPRKVAILAFGMRKPRSQASSILT